MTGSALPEVSRVLMVGGVRKPNLSREAFYSSSSQSPATAIHTAVPAMAAVSPRRIRGPRLIATRGGMRADRGALGIVEAAFRSDQQRGRAFCVAKGVCGRFAAILVSEEQVAVLRPVAQQEVEFCDRCDLGQSGARALLGRLGHDGARAFGR